MSERQKTIIAGAASSLGDTYDARYFPEGYPPEGRSACVDVVYFGYKNAGIDLQEEVQKDIQKAPQAYPGREEAAIDHRRCPNLITWFKRHAKSLPRGTAGRDLVHYQPGDVVFWSMADDGIADHAGIISDVTTLDGWPIAYTSCLPAAGWRIPWTSGKL